MIAFLDRGGSEDWQHEAGAEIGVLGLDGHTQNSKVTAVLIYDARENTVSLRDQSFPASPKFIYVIHVDDKWHPQLTLDNGNLELPNIPPDLRDELRALHESVLNAP